MAECRSTNARGEPCGRAPRVGQSFCDVHSPDPEVQALVTDARRKGGSNSGAPESEPVPMVVDLWSVEGRMKVIEHAVRSTLALRSSVGRARALAALIRVAHKVSTATKLADLEARLRQLETKQRDRPWQ